MVEYFETPLTEAVLQSLIAMSEDWEKENVCHGYAKNGREDIEGNRIFAACQDGEIIGYLFGHKAAAENSSSVMPAGTEYFEVEELYVKPEFRSQGIGRQLFALAENAAKAEGLSFLLLSTATKNCKAILHFYIDELEMNFWSARLFKKLRTESGPAIRMVRDPMEKQGISRRILEALPEWFGMEEGREQYIRESGEQPFFAAFAEGEPTGFLCLKETGKSTVELAVMGVRKEFQRKGLGRKLFRAAKEYAAARGYGFMQVKTVQMGLYEDYDRTNLFYQSLGFQEFEMFPTLWDKDNPCQVYVMALR